MSITSTYTDRFLSELLSAGHDFTRDKFYLALITGSPISDYGSLTSNYSNLGNDEVSGPGYVAGGMSLLSLGVSNVSGEAFSRFVSPTWINGTFVRAGGLLYNQSKANRAVMVLAWPNRIAVDNANFQVRIPGLNPAQALVELV